MAVHRSASKMGRERRAIVFLPCLGAAFSFWLFGTAYIQPTSPQKQQPRRRDALAAAGVAGLAGSVPTFIGADPASAEQTWQVKLPRTWFLYQKNEQPAPGDNRPVPLIVAGDNAAAGELVVLRVPLVTNEQSDLDTIKSQQQLISYFSTPAGKIPSVKISEAVEALAKSQRTTPGLTKFQLTGSPKERITNNQRYVSYEYESDLCQGSIVKAAGGKDRCETPEGEELPQLSRKRRITMTVVQEAEAKVPALWFVDMSAPAKSFDSLSGPLNDVSTSFEVTSEENLNKALESYTAKINEEGQKLAEKLAKEEELKAPK